MSWGRGHDNKDRELTLRSGFSKASPEGQPLRAVRRTSKGKDSRGPHVKRESQVRRARRAHPKCGSGQHEFKFREPT